MKLINLNSKKGVVCLFSDFIVSKIDPSLDSIIQVTQINDFFIINGTTESNKILDLKKIKDEFISENINLIKDLGYRETINTLDLIQYDKKIGNKSKKFLWSTFYNSVRPIYHDEVINLLSSEKDFTSIDYNDGVEYEIDTDSIMYPSKFKYSPLQITSEFPHGYSLSMNRLLFYYSEYVMNHVIKPSMAQKIDFFITNQKNTDKEPIFDIRFESPIPTTTIKSMILDNFSFDLSEFKEKIKNYNLCDDLKNPLSEKPWLTRDVNPKDLIVF